MPDSQTERDEGSEKEAALLNALKDERGKRQGLQTEVAELRGRIEGMASSQPKQEGTKELSRRELRQMVEDGKVSEDEAEDIVQRQLERRLGDRMVKALDDRLTTRQLNDKVQTEISRYKEAVPDLNDRESAAFQKVETEFQHLVSLGYDDGDPRTELLAARAAFGDPSRLKAVKSRGRETHEETGGHAESDSDVRTDGIPKGLTRRERDHYGKLIDRGLYKGWDDPVLKQELGFRNGPRAERAQARAS